MTRNSAWYHKANWLLLVVLLFAVGCGGDRGERGSKRSRNGANSSAEPTTPTAAPKLNEVHFFMETSASMGGYLRGGTQFKDVVSEVVTKTNQITPVTLWTIAEQSQKYNGTPAQFVQDLATVRLATGRSSKLHTIFEQVGKKAGNNSIALLVSDCILSFPDEEIRRNPEINRNDASSVLKNNIYDQFAQLNRRGIAATVYAFRSQFNGTYYDYQNRNHKLQGESRPFYIWVVGKQELLSDFTQKLQDVLSVQPAKTLTFGASNALQQHDVFFALNKKGKWRIERGGITEMRARPANPEEFAVGVNLNALPSYAQAEDYLRKNLVVSSKDAAIKLVNVQRKEALAGTARMTEREERLLNQNTHVLTFRVENMYGDNAAVSVKLPVRFDNWAQDWSTMDDRTPAGRQNKTFALQHLMNGVKEAYQSAGNEFLSFNLTLKK